MDIFLQAFDADSIYLVGALIMIMFAAMATAQVQQFPLYKSPLVALACGLIFGAIGIGYLALGLVKLESVNWVFAHAAGTTSYFFIVVSLLKLFRPDINPWKPVAILAIGLVGTLVFSTGVATLIWTTLARMSLIGFAVWAAATTRNKETPFLRRLALWLSALAIAGMIPHLVLLIESKTDITEMYNSKDPSAIIQALSWVISAVMSYFSIATIVQGRIAARLSHAADFDSLTNLNNRRALMRQGEVLVAKMTAVLMLIDVDYFKKINDTHGHLVGDAVLTHIAAVIKATVRSEDSVVGRYGGEEFCIMLRNASEQQGRMIAERVRVAVESSPYYLGDLALPVSISIGIAPAAYGQTLQGWIKKADEQLYTAKQAGRNQISSTFAFTATPA
jgi:diguanylate cyclase (GGDEF)-like protein